MSKICIIGASNIKHISLISLYTKYFDNNKIPYDIIYWDRYGIEEKTNAEKQICFKQVVGSGRINKIHIFLKFRRFVVKTCKENKYEFLITWQTTTAYLLFDYLLRKYKKHYVINVRDYIIENNVAIKIILKLLVKNAAFTAISSEGFLEFLPKNDYVKVNSINESILENVKVNTIQKNKKIYKVGFAGNCRYFRECHKLIKALGNNPNFEIWFCGTNSEHLKEFACKEGIDNVFVKPAFNPSETIDIFSGFDIVNSAFGNDAMDNRTLVPIRLYTAASLGLPTLVNVNTQLAKEVEKGGIGFVIKDYNTLGVDLLKYLNNLEQDTFNKSCQDYLMISRQENMKFYGRLNEIIKG